MRYTSGWWRSWERLHPSVTRIETGDASVYLYLVERDDADGQVYVAWHRNDDPDPYDAITAEAVMVYLPVNLTNPRIVTTSGTTKYVVWGQGAFTVPDGIGRMTSVISNGDGAFAWQVIVPGQSVPLSDFPLLLE